MLNALMQPKYKGILSGLYLQGLKIGGKFAAGTEFEDVVNWWNDVQRAITYLGLKVRPDAGINVELIPASNTGVYGWGEISTDLLVTEQNIRL
jgi:hypothetical protein